MDRSGRLLRLVPLAAAALAVAFAASLEARRPAGGPPAVGDHARDFTLNRLDGKAIRLSALTREGPVVMLMLRGWVGYQCPICNRQVGDFIAHGKAFQAAGANVILVYPGAWRAGCGRWSPRTQSAPVRSARGWRKPTPDSDAPQRPSL
jgi:AhpC/TSA family